MSQLPFMGETMTCIMSGETMQSDPQIESQWDCIVYCGKSYYVSKKWRNETEKAHGIHMTFGMVLEKMLELHKEGQS
jgi:hypothetical protein